MSDTSLNSEPGMYGNAHIVVMRCGVPETGGAKEGAGEDGGVDHMLSSPSTTTRVLEVSEGRIDGRVGAVS